MKITSEALLEWDKLAETPEAKALLAKGDAEELVNGTPVNQAVELPIPEPEPDKPVEEKKPKPTQAEVLLNLVNGTGAIFFHSDMNDLYAAIPVAQHIEVWPLDGKDFSTWLHGLYYKEIKPAAYQRKGTKPKQGGYDKWHRQLREAAFQRDNGLCQLCLKEGRYEPATIAHHIAEIIPNPELKYDLDNIMSLYRPCHEELHKRRRGVSKGFE